MDSVTAVEAFGERSTGKHETFGFQVSRIFPAFYFYRHKGKVVCVLTTHVDDFLWASIGVGGTIIDKLLKIFESRPPRVW